MKKILIALGLGIACMATPMLLNAQNKSKLESRVDRLVNRLGSENAELRKAAAEDLEDLGKDAKGFLKSARDAAKEAGKDDLAKRLTKIIGEEEAPKIRKILDRKDHRREEKGEELPPPLPNRPKVLNERFSSFKFALWENGKSTKFERDADGKYKVTLKNGTDPAKTSEFDSLEDLKKDAPELFKILRQNQPALPAPMPRQNKERRAPKGDRFNDILKVLEGMMPKREGEEENGLRRAFDQMRKLQEKVRDAQNEGRSPFDEKFFEDFFKDMPGGDPFERFKNRDGGSPFEGFKGFEDLFEEFKRARGPGDGGKLPKSKKQDDEEEHY